MSDTAKENMATMAFVCVTVLGLYAMGAGDNSLWGFLFLLNLK